MSLVIEVAEVVVKVLQADPLKLDAVRAYRPEFDLTELKTLRVSVVPKALAITSLGRRANQHDVSVDVGLQQKVDPTDAAALDALMKRVQQVIERLQLQRLDLPGGASAVWVQTSNEPIYSPEHLQNQQVFTSVVTVTYRVVR